MLPVPQACGPGYVWGAEGVESPIGHIARLPSGVWRSLPLEQNALACYYMASPPSLPSLTTSPPKCLASNSSSILQAPSMLRSTCTSSERPFLATLYHLLPLIIIVPVYFLHCTYQNLDLFSFFTCDCFSSTCKPYKCETLLALVTSEHQSKT